MRLIDAWTLESVLVFVGFARSKSEARRLLEQGAIRINDEKVNIGAKLVFAEGGKWALID